MKRSRRRYRGEKWRVALFGSVFLGLLCQGSLCARKDLDAEEIRLYRELSRANEDDPVPLLKLSSVYLRAGRPQKALRCLRQVVQMDPARAEAWVEMGNAFLASERTLEGIDAFERAVEIDPSLAPAYANLGLAHLKQGNPENAIRVLQTSLDIAPDQYLAHYHLAEAYWILKEEEKCISELESCIDLSPQFLRARMRLAGVLEEVERYEQAAKSYEEARALDPTHPLIHLRLGELYDHKMHETAKALQSYKSFLRWEEGGGRAVRRRMRLLIDRLYVNALRSYSVGRAEDSMNYVRSLLEIEPLHKGARDLAEQIRNSRREDY